VPQKSRQTEGLALRRVFPGPEAIDATGSSTMLGPRNDTVIGLSWDTGVFRYSDI